MGKIVGIVLALVALSHAQIPVFRPIPLIIRTGIPSHVGVPLSAHFPLTGVANPYRFLNLEKPDRYFSSFRIASGLQSGPWAFLCPDGKSIQAPLKTNLQDFRIVSGDIPALKMAALTLPEPFLKRPDAVVANKAIKPESFQPPVAQTTADTPEVSAAKLPHLKLWNKAKRRTQIP